MFWFHCVHMWKELVPCSDMKGTYSMCLFMFFTWGPSLSHGSENHCVAQVGFMLIEILMFQSTACLDIIISHYAKLTIIFFESFEPFSYMLYKILDMAILSKEIFITLKAHLILPM